MHTSFGHDAVPPRSGVKSPEYSSPIRLPDFAMEVSQADDEDSPMETQERPFVSSEEATTSVESSEPRSNRDGEKQSAPNRKSFAPVASMVGSLCLLIIRTAFFFQQKYVPTFLHIPFCLYSIIQFKVSSFKACSNFTCADLILPDDVALFTPSSLSYENVPTSSGPRFALVDLLWTARSTLPPRRESFLPMSLLDPSRIGMAYTCKYWTLTHLRSYNCLGKYVYFLSPKVVTALPYSNPGNHLSLNECRVVLEYSASPLHRIVHSLLSHLRC